MSSTEGIIRELLEEKFTEEGFNDCFIIEISLSKTGRLNIFVDSDSSLTLEKCKKISRYLEQHIDEKGWLGEKYVLEVSSPGVDRPLLFLRQYVKNKGRNLEITLKDGVKHEGKLTEVAGQTIFLEEKVSSPENKKKKITKETEIPFDQIERAIVKISFK